MQPDEATQEIVGDGAQKSPRRSIQWGLYVLILVAGLTQAYRISQVEAKDGKTPFLSANDRSRWCTIEALVGSGTYSIDHLIFRNPEKTSRTPWYTIDLVRHRGEDGKQHYYSSKPTLLPTLYAGVYWATSRVTGWGLADEPFLAGRTLLYVVNLLPFVLFGWLMVHWFVHQRKKETTEEPPAFANGNWSLAILALLLGWGTYLSTFTVTLNNHVPAAMAVALSLWCLERVAVLGDSRKRWFILCGLATSFGAANELPALSWVAAAGLILWICDWRKTLVVYSLSLLPVAVGFFGTNYLAHGTFAPAYAHRSAGDLLCEFPLSENAEEFFDSLEEHGIKCSQNASMTEARRPDTYELFDPESERIYAVKYTEETVQVYEWGDWYDYPNSYWKGNQSGVDKGEPDRLKYAFHCLVGHHGIFSLTPFWLLLPIGIAYAFRGGSNVLKNRPLLLVAAIVSTSVVVVAFYLARDLEDRNYGGVTSGLRWTFWLIPLWIWTIMFALRRTRTGWARRCVELLLVLSVISVSIPWSNPWTTPWLMEVWPVGPP